MTLYVPSATLGPKKGEEGADPLHKWNIYKGDLCTVLDMDTPYGWDLIEIEERDKDMEFGILTVVRKRADNEWHEDIWRRNPEGKLRALVDPLWRDWRRHRLRDDLPAAQGAGLPRLFEHDHAWRGDSPA